MRRQSWQSLLGLAYRAQKVVSGTEAVLQSVRENKAKIVLLADDASLQTKETIQKKCRYYAVPLYEVTNQYELGHAIGKEKRVAVAVNEEGFAKKLASLLCQTSWG